MTASACRFSLVHRSLTRHGRRDAALRPRCHPNRRVAYENLANLLACSRGERPATARAGSVGPDFREGHPHGESGLGMVVAGADLHVPPTLRSISASARLSCSRSRRMLAISSTAMRIVSTQSACAAMVPMRPSRSSLGQRSAMPFFSPTRRVTSDGKSNPPPDSSPIPHAGMDIPEAEERSRHVDRQEHGRPRRHVVVVHVAAVRPGVHVADRLPGGRRSDGPDHRSDREPDAGREDHVVSSTRRIFAWERSTTPVMRPQVGRIVV